MRAECHGTWLLGAPANPGEIFRPVCPSGVADLEANDTKSERRFRSLLHQYPAQVTLLG